MTHSFLPPSFMLPFSASVWALKCGIANSWMPLVLLGTNGADRYKLWPYLLLRLHPSGAPQWAETVLPHMQGRVHNCEPPAHIPLDRLVGASPKRHCQTLNALSYFPLNLFSICSEVVQSAIWLWLSLLLWLAIIIITIIIVMGSCQFAIALMNVNEQRHIMYARATWLLRLLLLLWVLLLLLLWWAVASLQGQLPLAVCSGSLLCFLFVSPCPSSLSKASNY